MFAHNFRLPPTRTQNGDFQAETIKILIFLAYYRQVR
jgi:hypothetical protein